MSFLFFLLPVLLCVSPFFLLLAVSLVKAFRKSYEKSISHILTYGMSFLFLFNLLNFYLSLSRQAITFELFKWYTVGHHSFSFLLKNDFNNALFSLVFTAVISLVGFFSRTYLHREKDFFYFFALYLVFQASVTLSVFSENLDTLFVGWELVGVASVLLINFYRQRKEPVKNSLWTLSYYRVGELFLLAALTLVHIQLEKTDFSHINTFKLDDSVVVMILIACFIKSAQFPFSAWLPRAMEGPTPSTAIFYGGVSTHMGPMLLLKIHPILEQYNFVPSLLVLVGILTALYGSSIGRISSDIKKQLAYATMAQLGLIYAEIGLGFYQLALYHSLVHCSVRTFQYLKSPSILSDYQKFSSRTPLRNMESFFSTTLRRSLYRLICSQYYVEFLIEFFFLNPFFVLSAWCAEKENSFLQKKTRETKRSRKLPMTQEEKNYASSRN